MGSKTGTASPLRLSLSIILVACMVLVLTGCFGGGGSKTAATQLEGTVLTFVADRSGTSSRPVAGATVTYGTKSVQTDANGRYRLTGLVKGSGTLVIGLGNDYPKQDFPVTVGSGTQQLDVQIKNLHQLYQMGGGTTAPSKEALDRALKGAHGSPTDSCGVCHAAQGADKAQLADFSNALCTKCHTAPGFQHPTSHLTVQVGAYPQLDPRALATDYNNLSCLTCHRPHKLKEYTDWTAQGLLVTPQLGRDNNCVRCHPTSSIPTTHPQIPDNTCSCHDRNGVPKGHATCSGYSGKYGTPCHTSSATLKTQMAGKHTSLANGCTSCHDVSGTATKLLRFSSNTNQMCYGCHKFGLTGQYADAGHGKCTMCHDPHKAQAAYLTNPAAPGGAPVAVTKETYRNQNMVPNAVCQSCHKATPPASYPTAKDPYSETQFYNNDVKPDRVLHRVHVDKLYPDNVWHGDHGAPTYRTNNVRCVMCHSTHPTTKAYNLIPSVVLSVSKVGTGYSRAGCSLSGNCHTCNYCHANPGGPGEDCVCSGYHSYYQHEVVY